VQAQVLEYPLIYINGGRRGYLVGIAPQALVDLLQARPVSVALEIVVSAVFRYYSARLRLPHNVPSGTKLADVLPWRAYGLQRKHKGRRAMSPRQSATAPQPGDGYGQEAADAGGRLRRRLRNHGALPGAAGGGAHRARRVPRQKGGRQRRYR